MKAMLGKINESFKFFFMRWYLAVASTPFFPLIFGNLGSLVRLFEHPHHNFTNAQPTSGAVH